MALAEALLLAAQLTAVDAKCLANNMYWEVRDNQPKAMISTALVVLNRVKSKRWPNTVCKVVHQRNQFSWYWDGKSDKPFKHELSVYRSATFYTSAILEGGIEDWTYDATHYHAHSVKPNWNFKLLEETYRDEYHIYYRYKGEYEEQSE